MYMYTQGGQNSRRRLRQGHQSSDDMYRTSNRRFFERRVRMCTRMRLVCVVFCCLHIPGERIVVSCMLAHTRHPAPPAGHGRGRVGREVAVSLLVNQKHLLTCRGSHRHACSSSLMKAARVLAEVHPCVTDRATTIHTLCDDRRTVRWRQSPCSHGRQARHIMSVFCTMSLSLT